MNIERITKFLTGNGYRKEPDGVSHLHHELTNFYRATAVNEYGLNLPLCLGNDSPPQLEIKVYERRYLEIPDLAFEISITNEAEVAWIDFKFYGVGESELMENLQNFENRLLKAWVAVFNK